MMRRYLTLISAISVVLAVVSFGYAQQEVGMREGKAKGMQKLGGGQFMLHKFDINKDGKIAQREWIAGFKAMDADGDGILTQEEIAEHQHQARQEAGKNIFQRFDKNGDGFISKDEFPGREEKFAQIDANSDGQISHEELKAVAENMRKQKDEDGKVRKMMRKGHDPNSVQ